jgi:hypothetical protein
MKFQTGEIMNSKTDPEEVGERLGTAGVETMLEKLEAYCTQEVQRIELTNDPRVVALQAESLLLLKEEETLENEIRNAPPPIAPRNRIRRKVYAWGIVSLLALSGFIFSVVALDPFRLGWKGYLYCVGIAVVTPFLIHTVLERFNSARLIKSVVASGAVAAIASLVLVAVIRGDVLVQELGTVKAAVLLDDAPPSAPQYDFYGATLRCFAWSWRCLRSQWNWAQPRLGRGLAVGRGVRNKCGAHPETT